MKRTTARALLATLAFAAATVSTAAGQAPTVRLEGRGDVAIDTVLQRIVRSGAYRLLAADTVYPATDTIRGPVLIAGTTAKFEGVIEGDVAIVDANVFLRPGARITGDVVSIGAGLFQAPNATIEGELRQWPEALYFASLDATRSSVTITASGAASLFDLDGFGGFHLPAYDRVSGLTGAIGARYRLPRLGLTEPEIHGWVGYQTAREQLIGGADAGFRRGSYRLSAGAERTTLTNDAWVRGWTNSITYFWTGRDYRDYYAADRFFLRQTLERSTLYSTVTFGLTAQVEDATSLPSRNPWHALNDEARLNPPIDDGRISSLIVSADGEWEHETWLGSAHASIETASEVLGGERSFTSFDLGGEFAMLALADHTLRLHWRVRGPIGSDSLPRQRWNTIGGRATLATLDLGELRGDRLVYAETSYIIPIPGIRLPVLDRPSVTLHHRIGNAWQYGQDTKLIQNIGMRFSFRFFFVGFLVDPAERSSSEILYGFTLLRTWPWTPFD